MNGSESDDGDEPSGSRPKCMSWDPETRVRIRTGVAGEGNSGRVIGASIKAGGQYWTPVLWDDEEDPDWFKSAGLEVEPPVEEHHVTVSVKSSKPFNEVLSLVLESVRRGPFTGGMSATGVDLERLRSNLERITRERNDAVTELNACLGRQEREALKRRRR